MSENLRLADLTFPSGDAEIRAFGARPRGKGPFPGLVVVPDVRGLYEHFRDVAERYAAEGFLTLVVDLYSREGAPELADMDAIFQWMHDLPDRRVLADLAAAVAFLESNPLVRDGSVAIAGYCMGGKYALMAAATVPGLAAAVSWYGMLDEPEPDEANPESPISMASRLACPWLGLFGTDDALIPAAKVERLRSALTAAGREFEIESYQGAGHAFANDSRPDTYRPDAARRAWQRAVAFLRSKTARA